MAMPEIANQHQRASLPLMWALSISALIKWSIGMVGGIALIYSQKEESEAKSVLENAAILGTALYCVLLILPQIVNGQSFVIKLIYYRDSLNGPIAFVVAVVFPWIIGALVHSYNTVISLSSLLSIWLVVLITYISPIFFYCKCAREAAYYEANFRLSLK